MIRAVIDTSVLVSAFIGHPDAAPARLVAAWRDRAFTLIASPRLLDELADVLGRPKFELWAGEGRGLAYVAAFAARAELHPDRKAIPATRDSNDDYLVALARASRADFVVSVDLDLVEAELEDVVVIDPAHLVARLGPQGQ